jgi:chorismate dehydratase
MLKVGIVDYVNALPFITAFEKKFVECPFEIIKDVPARLNEMLANDKLDICLMSSSEFVKNQDKYQILSNYCIGARQEVQSVKLYIKEPLKYLDAKTIWLTIQSNASIKIVEVLCHHFWNIQPNFQTFNHISDIHNYPAFLLIGDLCLKNADIPGHESIDLAQEWYKYTGLPFTFAVFAVRNQVIQKKAEAVKVFEHALTEAVIWAKENVKELSMIGSVKSGLSTEVVANYLNLLNYSFDKGQQKGLDQFSRLIEQLPKYEMV